MIHYSKHRSNNTKSLDLLRSGAAPFSCSAVGHSGEWLSVLDSLVLLSSAHAEQPLNWGTETKYLWYAYEHFTWFKEITCENLWAVTGLKFFLRYVLSQNCYDRVKTAIHHADPLVKSSESFTDSLRDLTHHRLLLYRDFFLGNQTYQWNLKMKAQKRVQRSA